MTINILIPVLNEERRVERGVRSAVKFMDMHFAGCYCITVVDNGSTDRTPTIMRSLEKEIKTVYYLPISEKGVGAALRAGIEHNQMDLVGYMDVDLSTDLNHLKDVMKIFSSNENVQIVNGSRLSRDSQTSGRKPIRNITSYGLKYILKLVFGMKIDDAICGFKFFRKNVAEKLVAESGKENGWFYCIELLLRAERKGILIQEIPVIWKDDYDTTVHVKKLILNYLKCIYQLKKTFRMENRKVGHETIR